ncbi:Methylmalonyl-CoA epimerase, mitochondrial [Porphyridium purpureum]|uniref:Methylmalonyl-CoA epimerase, mitochondrial n=1 Tax=Porphyridium purpureum TaxID=35688 RepID=A0A5J4Z135_PORPP|nr:Methylmalonyl-CoA epimerase, mitochondrial [Porphyridium purpureum]|eukprot:POR5341..scf208_2
MFHALSPMWRGAAKCWARALPTLSKTSSLPSRFFSEWKLGKLNHIAIATTDVNKAGAFYRDVLGATVSPVQPLPEHGVSVVFVELQNKSKIELLEPLGDTSPIQNFLSKNPGGGVHHICLEVSDIAKAVAHLRKQNVRTLTETTKIGAHGKPVMFLHPKDCNGVLIEIEQE